MEIKMKAIIFSDSHRSFEPMVKAMDAEKDISQIIHAGDVYSDVEDLEIMFPKTPIAAVKGNNDWLLYGVPEERVFELGGVKILLTHGHNYGVKYSLSKLLQRAVSLDVNLVVFGHTHVTYSETIGNITLFNPGPASKSYGVFEAANGIFDIRYKKLP
jgi:putative phosphoesterase